MYNDVAKNKPNHSTEFSSFIVQPHLLNSRQISRKQYVINGNFTNF